MEIGNENRYRNQKERRCVITTLVVITMIMIGMAVVGIAVTVVFAVVYVSGVVLLFVFLFRKQVIDACSNCIDTGRVSSRRNTRVSVRRNSRFTPRWSTGIPERTVNVINAPTVSSVTTEPNTDLQDSMEDCNEHDLPPSYEQSKNSRKPDFLDPMRFIFCSPPSYPGFVNKSLSIALHPI